MNELWEMVAVLEEDIKRMADLLIANQKDQTCERAYVRIVFSALDGVLNLLKSEMSSSKEFDTIFSKKERARILDRKYDQKTDTVKSEQLFQSPKDTIRETLKFYARYKKRNNYEFPNNSGWQDMITAIKIRNKITHPKKRKDLDISVSDLEKILRAKNWLRDEALEPLA